MAGAAWSRSSAVRRLADDPRFRTNPARVAHRRELLEVVETAFRKWPATELCKRLWGATVPAGPVNSVDEVFADPQVLHAFAGGLPIRGRTGPRMRSRHVGP